MTETERFEGGDGLGSCERVGEAKGERWIDG